MLFPYQIKPTCRWLGVSTNEMVPLQTHDLLTFRNGLKLTGGGILIEVFVNNKPDINTTWSENFISFQTSFVKLCYDL